MITDQCPSRLWAITSYFNPVGYQRRLENYRIFRQRLTVPLVTVELSFAPVFELAKEVSWSTRIPFRPSAT